MAIDPDAPLVRDEEAVASSAGAAARRASRVPERGRNQGHLQPQGDNETGPDRPRSS